MDTKKGNDVLSDSLNVRQQEKNETARRNLHIGKKNDLKSELVKDKKALNMTPENQKAKKKTEHVSISNEFVLNRLKLPQM